MSGSEMRQAAKDRDCEALCERLIGAFDAHDRLWECLERNDDELTAAAAESVWSDITVVSSTYKVVYDEVSALRLSLLATISKAEPATKRVKLPFYGDNAINDRPKAKKAVAAHLDLLRETILEHQPLIESRISSWRTALEDEACRAFAKREAVGKFYWEDFGETPASNEAQSGLGPNEFALADDLFAVRWGNRAPYVVGSGKLFQFLKALAKTPGRFVALGDIMERMGDDSQYADQLAAIKCRLDDRLRAAHYGPIADCIQSQRGHYGLILSGESK